MFFLLTHTFEEVLRECIEEQPELAEKPFPASKSKWSKDMCSTKTGGLCTSQNVEHQPEQLLQTEKATVLNTPMIVDQRRKQQRVLVQKNFHRKTLAVLLMRRSR